MGAEALPPEAPILPPIGETGQDDAHRAAVESFVERVRNLTDEDRRVVAERRRKLDEAFHEKALRAGAEALPPHASLYVRARTQVANAHLPSRLEEGTRDAEWEEISRLVQLAIDEGLIAIVGQGTLHPNHLRELIAPWPA
jgi:hypothetical protein